MVPAPFRNLPTMTGSGRDWIRPSDGGRSNCPGGGIVGAMGLEAAARPAATRGDNRGWSCFPFQNVEGRAANAPPWTPES